MKKRKYAVVDLIVCITGVFISLYLLRYFNANILIEISNIYIKALVLVVIQWFLLIVPVILMLARKENFSFLGFKRKKILKQLLIGLVFALLMSLVFTLLPEALGMDVYKNENTNNEYRTFIIIFEFVYMLLGVALVEEIIFRGYIFHKLLEVKNSKLFAILVSSIIFGFFHIFSGDILQIIMTTIIGIIFCLIREKVKDATTLSLVVTHGVYNALLPLVSLIF